MPIEAIILAICMSGGSGCTEAIRHYYAVKPDVKQSIDHYKKGAEIRLGKETIVIFGAAVALASDREARIKLNKNYHIRISKEKKVLEYTIEF